MVSSFPDLLDSGQYTASLSHYCMTPYQRPQPCLHRFTCFCLQKSSDATFFWANLKLDIVIINFYTIRFQIFYITFKAFGYPYQIAKTAILYHQVAWQPSLFVSKHFLNPFLVILCLALILHSREMPSNWH